MDNKNGLEEIPIEQNNEEDSISDILKESVDEMLSMEKSTEDTISDVLEKSTEDTISDILKESMDEMLSMEKSAEDTISDTLKESVEGMLGEESAASEDRLIQRKRRMKKILIISGAVAAVLLCFSLWLTATNSGRRVVYRMVGKYIFDHTRKDEPHISAVGDKTVDTVPNTSDPVTNPYNTLPEVTPVPEAKPRQEDYVTNILIFGVEEMEYAKNTDTIMLVSINTKDKTIKLTSILRDTYLEDRENKPKKLNSIFASKGASGFVEEIERNFLIKVDGYAYLNFKSFETIVNYLGGISIQLGEQEARYLNRTNYISEKSNRNVKAGWNVLNGNQALGYCRVRRVPTLGGATDDYGRTLRQRRVLTAIFNKYKSKNFMDLLTIANKCLDHVTTNLTGDQIAGLLEDVIENKITDLDTLRIPANNTYDTPREWNGIDDPLVILDWDENRIELYKFIYLDTQEEAEQVLSVLNPK